MHLRFTEEELATLVEMVSLAAELANLNPNDDGNEGFARFEAVESKILESAKHSGMSDMIEFDHSRGKNRVTEKYQENAFFQKCIDEFRNANFWEELMARLTERDLIREMGEPAYLALSEEARRKKSEPLEKRYWGKFLKDGVNPLFWIDRNEDA